MKLARFRADPQKVRVALRRDGSKWRASVRTVVPGDFDEVVRYGFTPSAAIVAALEAADELPGVDLGMRRIYEHPFRGTDV